MHDFLRKGIVVPFALFGLIIIAIAAAAERLSLAVYLLSFWHYGAYALAFFWRRIPLGMFMFDAVLLKSVSFAALASVLFVVQPNPIVFICLASGFGLNAAAARLLGPDRTYYGHELGKMPMQLVSAFPYSVTAHPMLFGNMAAYSGLLLDDMLRMHWWPLAAIHVALNVLLLAMESRGSGNPRFGVLWLSVGIVFGAVALVVTYQDILPFVVAAFATCAGFGSILFRRYTTIARHNLLVKRPS